MVGWLRQAHPPLLDGLSSPAGRAHSSSPGLQDPQGQWPGFPDHQVEEVEVPSPLLFSTMPASPVPGSGQREGQLSCIPFSSISHPYPGTLNQQSLSYSAGHSPEPLPMKQTRMVFGWDNGNT